MRYLTALSLWLLPCTLLCGDPGDYTRAETLARQTLKNLTPPGDAAFDFKQTVRQLGHLSRPWQTWGRDIAGGFALADNASSFYQTDSTMFGNAFRTSFTYCCDTTLMMVGYGRKEPMGLTQKDRREFLYDVSALTPVFLLRDFLAHGGGRSFLRYVPGPADSLVYRAEDGNIISLAIDPAAKELRSASVLYSHTLYGDVLKTLTFSDYVPSGTFSYPARIVQHELGYDASVVSVTPGREAFDKSRITSMIPAGYALAADRPEPEAVIATIDFNPHVHFLDLAHADSRVMVVEFKDYLLVADAPLTTANGEMIIRKAKEIAPGKPVRYFMFGHHHPHYIGGIRAFVHDGATVLTVPGDSAYLRQLASFRRALEPDVLEKEPRPLKMEFVDGEKILSDGDLEMRIIHIGAMSDHTDDYLICYFPKYKFLFQDDLAGIPKEKPAPASKRQKGLYDAIRLHNLDVETIVQGWPLEDDRAKNTFSFDELRKSVEMIGTEK